MDLTNMASEVINESDLEFAELQIQQLQELDLCLVGGGMGDVQQ
ncbi:MAG TPA: hypothetical protein VN782_11340 [Usitatibacter sp.]|nr:hypothetical protein [Usitatibacter sp.]